MTYGVRVPLFLISPWVEPGSVHHENWDFGSILKTILERFCPDTKPFMSDRVRAASHFGKALSLTEPRRITDAPAAMARPAVRAALRMRTKYFQKSDFTKPDADWHEFMTVLGRMTRGQ